VGVGGVDEVVVSLFAAAEVDLFEEARVEEVFEGAVDGGFGSAVGAFAEGEEKFFGFEGTAEFLDGVEDGEAFGGELQASLAEEIAKDMLGGIHGGMIDGGRDGVNNSFTTEARRHGDFSFLFSSVSPCLRGESSVLWRVRR